jgi:hypothetical protein
MDDAAQYVKFSPRGEHLFNATARHVSPRSLRARRQITGIKIWAQKKGEAEASPA